MERCTALHAGGDDKPAVTAMGAAEPAAEEPAAEEPAAEEPAAEEPAAEEPEII